MQLKCTMSAKFAGAREVVLVGAKRKIGRHVRLRVRTSHQLGCPRPTAPRRGTR